MFLAKLARKKTVAAKTIVGVKAIVGAIAVVGAAVPIALAVRKQLSARTARIKLSQAKEAGRKAPHAGKPRKARRIARHLAKTLRPVAGA